MTTDKSRAAFEAHIDDCIESEVGLEQALVKDGFGDYCVTWVASKWKTWQASREMALNEAADAIIKMNLNELQQDQYLLNYTAQLMTSTAEQIRRFV